LAFLDSDLITLPNPDQNHSKKVKTYAAFGCPNY
jgi:hypothetical protein